MEFTGVKHDGGAELTAPVEKAMTGSWRRLQWVRALEKPAVGGKRGGEGGRRAAVLWRGGDVGQRSGGAMESAVAEAAQRSAIAESYRGAAVR